MDINTHMIVEVKKTLESLQYTVDSTNRGLEKEHIAKKCL